MTKIIIDWINLNSNLLIAFLTLITVGVLIWYSTETRRLVKRTAESIELTKEKDNLERLIKIIDNFEFVKLKDILVMKKEDLHKGSESLKVRINLDSELIDPLKDIEYFINYFDTISILYFENKIDLKMFNSKFKDLFIGFIIFFKNEIFSVIVENGVRC